MQYGITTDQFGHADEVEETPLAHACACGFLKIVQVLIEKGANVNFLCSVCHYIVFMQKMMIMVLLFCQGTVPPLGYAIVRSQMHIVEFLLSCPKVDTTIFGVSGPK